MSLFAATLSSHDFRAPLGLSAIQALKMLPAVTRSVSSCCRVHQRLEHGRLRGGIQTLAKGMKK